jgi:MOSC domain-containing protein YiiM
VYAVARDELAHWAAEVGRDLPPGAFGENLTITGLDVDGALVGEIWAIGDVVRLQVTGPRDPVRDLREGHGRGQRWVKRFTVRGRTGAYLRVLTPGPVQAGDAVVVESRPGPRDHRPADVPGAHDRAAPAPAARRRSVPTSARRAAASSRPTASGSTDGRMP